MGHYGLRRRWARRSRRTRAGRPAVDHHIRTLIGEMALANPLWGAPPITASFLHSPSTSPSAPCRANWRADLVRPPKRGGRSSPITSRLSFRWISSRCQRSPAACCSCSSCCRTTDAESCNVNCTHHPTSTWMAQQLVEAFPEDTAPGWLLRDRDRIYNDEVHRRIATLGITEVVSSPLSPWQSPYVERLIGSIRRECLDHVIVLGQAQLRRILRA